MTKPTGNAVLVKILDREYQIACPPEERQALQDAARQLDERMRDIRTSGHVIGMERIAVMAALNLSHDLLQEKRSPEPSSSPEVAKIIEKLDKTLTQFS